MFSGGGGGEEEQRWFAARNGGSCCGVMGVLPLLLVPLFFCFFLSLLLLCFYSSSFLSPIFSISGLFFLSLSLPVPLFLLVFMGKKWGERSTTPVQSWHRGREWSGGHWAAAYRGCALCFFRLMAGDGLGFCQCLDRWEREGAGKKTGEQTSSSPASACAGKEEQCRSKRHCFSFCFLKRK